MLNKAITQPIGFTHGVLYRMLDKFSRDIFEIYAESGSEIIEISWNSVAEGAELMKIVPWTQGYPRKSLHLPCDLRYANDALTQEVLNKAMDFYQTIGAELAIVHPDLIDDASVFERYPLNWAIENNDCRKKRFREVDEVKQFFSDHPTWNLVLDVNHCFSNDPSMALADCFIEDFSSRIKEVHVSGYTGYHEPLYKTDQKIILAACSKLAAPIIIESVFDSVDEVEKEITYIKNYLRGA